MFQKVWNQSRRKYHPLCFFGAWPGAHHSKRLCNSSAALCRVVGCWPSKAVVCDTVSRGSHFVNSMKRLFCLLHVFCCFFLFSTQKWAIIRHRQELPIQDIYQVEVLPPLRLLHILLHKGACCKNILTLKRFLSLGKRISYIKKCANVIEDINCAVLS